MKALTSLSLELVSTILQDRCTTLLCMMLSIQIPCKKQLRLGVPRQPLAAVGKSLLRIHTLQRPPWHMRVLRSTIQYSLMQPCCEGSFVDNAIRTADMQGYIESTWIKDPALKQ